MWDPNYVILDDELHDLFIQLPQNVLLEVFMDTCHSGTGLKAVDLLLDRRPRYMPPPSFEVFEKVDGRVSRGLNKALLEKGITHHILLAGCRSDQTSAGMMKKRFILYPKYDPVFVPFLLQYPNASFLID